MEEEWGFEECREIDSFQILDVIGEGTYGTVYKAVDSKGDGGVYALKKVRVHSEREGFPKTALREINILKRMKHHNIIELNDVVIRFRSGRKEAKQNAGKSRENHESNDSNRDSIYSRPDVYLVFEYCEYDLAYVISKLKRPFSSGEVKYIASKILCALNYLHMNYVIHRDVKLSNLLINKKGHVKLADFGLSKIFREPNIPMTENVVTLWYRAPELLLGVKKYNEKVDMWAFGCIFGELLLNRPLLPGCSEQNQMNLICNLLGRPSPKIWPELESLPLYDQFHLPSDKYNNLIEKFRNETKNCVDLLNRSLTYDPGKRISAREALVHPYFTEKPFPVPIDSISTLPSCRISDHTRDKFVPKRIVPTYASNVTKSSRSRMLLAAKNFRRPFEF